MADEQLLRDIAAAVRRGKGKQVASLAEEALEEGAENGEAKAILDAMIAEMNVIGELFREGKLYVPEMLMSARAMKQGLQTLRPALVSGDVKPAGKVVIGTVEGDQHDIGKNIVAIMLQSAGYEVIDLGVDVSPQRFLEAALEHGADIVGMSTLLTTTMPAMQKAVEAFSIAGVRDKVRIMIGGSPVSWEYARRIGADGYSEDAAEAVLLAGRLLGANA